MAERGARLLIADDNKVNRLLMSRSVELQGYRATLAENGRIALERLRAEPFDLLLLDIEMPEMDGFAVLDALRGRESTRDIPVIILTARLLSAADLERCQQGVANILGKGLFSTAETLAHIEAALERRSPLGRSTRQLVRRAMAFIHAHYTEPIEREAIAGHIGISADYLTDCFHQELGLTPIIYLRRYRIRQACELLRTTDLPITQVALNVGFSDGAHFARTFQRETGLTPKAYRRQA